MLRFGVKENCAAAPKVGDSTEVQTRRAATGRSSRLAGKGAWSDISSPDCGSFAKLDDDPKDSAMRDQIGKIA